MESDCVSDRLKTTPTHDPSRHDNDSPTKSSRHTTKAHDQDEGGADDNDDTLLILT